MASPWLDPPMTPVAYVGAAVRPRTSRRRHGPVRCRRAASRGRRRPARRALGGAALPETPTRRDRALDALRCSLSGGRAGSDDDGFDGAEALSDSGLDATFDALCGVGDGDESDDDGGPWPAIFGGERLGPCFVAVAASTGDRHTATEDTWATIIRGDGAAVLCVFDGHGGAQAAAWLAENFPAYRWPADAVRAHGLGGDPGEFERVKASGAHWANGGRVNGVLRVSRRRPRLRGRARARRLALDYAADPIIAAPAVVARDRRADDAVLALATDGVGDAFPDPAGPAAFARARLRAHGDVDRAARETLAEARARGATDDATLVLVDLAPRPSDARAPDATPPPPSDDAAPPPPPSDGAALPPPPPPPPPLRSQKARVAWKL
ncbi:hypothetical protein JL721_4567 [Aureococcus anophagefferens]|nr:hypothetical protein JL721_4567 [Aureococcus anophagefferens]